MIYEFDVHPDALPAPMHALYLGAADGRPFTVDDRAAVEHLAAAAFPSFTMVDAEGRYDGRQVATLILRIATSDRSAVVALARRLGRALGQRAVGHEAHGLYRAIPTDISETRRQSR